MKFKSYGFWTSLAGGAVVIAGIFAKTFGLEISENVVSDIIMGIAGVLVVFGIVKMPKEKSEKEEKQIEIKADEQHKKRNVKNTKNIKNSKKQVEEENIKAKKQDADNLNDENLHNEKVD